MTASKKILIIFLALGLFAMLAVSLYQRFLHPSLVVTRLESAAPEQSEIGQLMEQAARKPKDRRILLQLVEKLMAIGQWQGAENFAQRALAVDGDNGPDSRPLYLLAVIHHNQGRHKEAADLLQKLLAKTENPSARYSLAILYLHFLHEPGAGIEQLEKGLTLPDLPESLKGAMREELAKARALMPPAQSDEAGAPQGEAGENGAS